MNCSTACSRMFSVRVTPRAAARRSRSSTPMTVSLTYLKAFSWGHDALDKLAGDVRATHPDFVYAPHGAPQALHNAGRLAWGSGPRGEKPVYTGEDVIIVRDGKIAALYGFLDSKSMP